MSAPLDEIRLTGLRATAHHGVFEHERRDGQDFFIDLIVRLPLGPAAAGDDLAATVHYGELAEQVVAAVEVDRVALSFPAAHEVVVTVHKPSAPITVPFDDVSVTIHRSRA